MGYIYLTMEYTSELYQPKKIRHIPLKRIFDLSFALSILICLLPLYLLLAIIIKYSSKGPIFYSHYRIGRGGLPFKLYKFRTMRSDADQILKQLLMCNPALNNEWKSSQKLYNDPRITPIGKWLRKFSLDELPQFFNVLKGDLSVVGPRPVLKEELIEHYHSHAPKILSIRPGITGLWQISGRSNTSYEKRTQLDLRYVHTRNFWTDCKIIIKTIPAIFSTTGAI